MATEKRLIDANALTDKFLRHYTEQEKKGNLSFVACEIKQGFADMVSEAPTVDAAPVVHGRWKKAHINGYLKCNHCEDAFIYADWLESGKWNYCPNCGAKMRGDSE